MTASIFTRRLRLGFLWPLLLLAACSHTRLVDSEVQQTAAFGPGGAPTPPVAYRFERLPSQVQNADLGLLEQAAQTQLQTKGWVRDDAAARYSVMLEWRASTYLADPWGRPMESAMTPYFYGVWGSMGTGSAGFSAALRMPPTHHRRELRVLVRDLKTSQLVYETQARHDGPWHDGANIAPVVVQAALADFPNPKAALQKIVIELPPKDKP